jgi:aspartyl-tRNA synthetase
VNGEERSPFRKEWKRSHRCGELHSGDEGTAVVLNGWVKKVRELGNLTFLDLWDRTGLVQLVVEKASGELHELFRGLRAEDVIACEGVVRRRPADMVNPDMATGGIEVVVSRAAVLNRSEVPPFTVATEVRANEDLRLRYRYLDLRREPLQRNIELRHRLALSVRNFLSREEFLEIETPILVRRTPEGARDYLVPSRLQPGKFYALPQSPQLYKQILMIAGFDRYFQLPRCLRDEDLRADRQPEHTQIDIEMSFVVEDDIFDVSERLMRAAFRDVLGVELQIPFPRLSYDEVMLRYGTDKPDLRFGLEIEDVSDLFTASTFKVFREAVAAGGVVRGFALAEGTAFSRSRIGKLETLVKRSGAGGLVTIQTDGESVTSPIAKHLSREELGSLLERFSVGSGHRSLIMLVAGDADRSAKALGELRSHLGAEYLQGDANGFHFLWVNRFPLFEKGEEGGWQPAHHIFSMPLEGDIPLLDEDPGAVRGHLYDLVCNGTELGSGSIRVHCRELQEKLFKIIGIEDQQAERRFGFLLEAFQYGAPPHGGIALGLDRIAMVLGGGNSIRDFIAFPKTQRATSLMEGAPSEVEEDLLRELHIKVIARRNRDG